jgi:hypothetical protein
MASISTGIVLADISRNDAERASSASSGGRARPVDRITLG